MQRPWMFVSGAEIDGLRSVADVRRGIREGHAAELWQDLLAKVEREMQEEPIAPYDGNRNFIIVARTANRLVDASLVALVTDERRYADAAMAQIDALFDHERWPEWQDAAHLAVGYKADLRHGQLARALGMAYDWLHGMLTEEERQRFLTGLDKRAIGPFKAGVEAKDMWLDRRSNWQTCVVGGFGILGLALGADHPDSEWLVSIATPRMHAYVDVIGPEGEFNESVQYSGSSMYLVDYLLAEYYASGGREGIELMPRLQDYCRWTMYCTVPPGRVFGFGDPLPDMPPAVAHFGGIAAVLRDPLIQWFYRQYADVSLDTHRRRALELLFFDPTLPAVSPHGRLPLGRAFHHQAKILSSRNSWDPLMTTSVVYAKAGREDYHGHADWGQVCIDGYAERLIVDLGSPRGGYPKDHKEMYYNYQQASHNVVMIGENDTGGVSMWERVDGEIDQAVFSDAVGGAWSMDLSPVYGQGRRVRRHVVHLLPRIAVVLDVVDLAEAELVRLRWHPCAEPAMEEDGAFTFAGNEAAVSARVLCLDDPGATVTLGRHEYHPPYDRNRGGRPYRYTHEPFVQIAQETPTCRFLSLFGIFSAQNEVPSWDQSQDGWRIQTPEGRIWVRVTSDSIDVLNEATDRIWHLNVSAAGKAAADD